VISRIRKARKSLRKYSASQPGLEKWADSQGNRTQLSHGNMFFSSIYLKSELILLNVILFFGL
jgi:hypothetical protein